MKAKKLPITWLPITCKPKYANKEGEIKQNKIGHDFNFQGASNLVKEPSAAIGTTYQHERTYNIPHEYKRRRTEDASL